MYLDSGRSEEWGKRTAIGVATNAPPVTVNWALFNESKGGLLTNHLLAVYVKGKVFTIPG